MQTISIVTNHVTVTNSIQVMIISYFIVHVTSILFITTYVPQEMGQVINCIMSGIVC